jgi:GAF domain-containing protein
MLPPSEPAEEAARLADLEACRILDTAPEAGFDDLVRVAAQLAGTPTALISLVDRERQWFKARLGLEATETPRDISFCGHVVAGDRTLVVPDALRDDRFADNPLVLSGPRIRFYAGAPVHSAAGRVLGTLCVIDTRPRRPGSGRIQLLEALARQAASLLDLRRRVLVQDEFINTMSHELRTPLTTVRGSLGLLRSGALGALREETLDLLEIAGKGADRLAEVADDGLRRLEADLVPTRSSPHPSADPSDDASSAP